MMLVVALCFAHRVGCVFSKVLRQFFDRFFNLRQRGVFLFPRESHRISWVKQESGFTLMELLVVVALMSLVALAAVMSLDNVDDTASIQIARSEMVEISKALKLFKRDVGYFPDADDEIQYVGTPDPVKESTYVEAGKLNLLRTCQASDESKNKVVVPTEVSTPIVVPTYDVHCNGWNIDTARGWHGPYLSRDGNTVFVNDPWGSPYVLRGSGSDIRIISFGADGAYGGDHAVVDPVDICKANDASASGKDDLVLCLLM